MEVVKKFLMVVRYLICMNDLFFIFINKRWKCSLVYFRVDIVILYGIIKCVLVGMFLKLCNKRISFY